MSIVLDSVSKRFDDQAVVHEVSLEVGQKELLVLLGPSGSGKSTLLRLIAGLLPLDGGRLLFDGEDVSTQPARERGVGFVFQSYALFRTMTVAANVEFALKVRKTPRAERGRRAEELLELVGLAGLGRRMPHQLSGGQRQRVALARALAHPPRALLLDEPFGALDAKIRTELRQTLKRIQRQLGIPTVFVTHDQDEAFELGDRVAVLHHGHLLEVGPPQELYLRPATEFVATFLGTANLMVGESTAKGVKLGPVELPLATQGAATDERRRVQVLFRPEDVAVKDSLEALEHPSLGVAEVEQSLLVGDIERLRLRLPPLPGVRAIAPPVPFGADFVAVEASRPQHLALRFPLRAGDKAWVGVRRLHALPHPGLAILAATGGSRAGEAALKLGGDLARLARARLTLLAASLGTLELTTGPASTEQRSSELPLAEALSDELDRRLYNLVVLGADHPEILDLAEKALRRGDQHLLMVPERMPVPSRFVIGVAVGEPGKNDVRFAGRLARHLGARATLMTVLPAGASTPAAERFLAAGVRSLAAMGVPAEAKIRRGQALPQLLEEVAGEPGALLVLGAPLPDAGGRVRLGGLVATLLAQASHPVLIVHSRQEVA